MERQPIPGNSPGIADHAPSQEVVAGEGPAGEPACRDFRVLTGFRVFDALHYQARTSWPSADSGR